jgi:hypothetical protein
MAVAYHVPVEAARLVLVADLAACQESKEKFIVVEKPVGVNRMGSRIRRVSGSKGTSNYHLY